MMKRRWIGGIGFAFLIAVLFSPVVAAGQYVEIQWQVSGSGEQSGTINTGLDWDVIYANPLLTYAWNLPSTINIDLGGGNIAYIDGLSIGVKADPFIDFTFAARSANGPTHFAFSSALLNINPALAAGAQASAWANPSPGPPDTILTGDFNGKVYRAEYNGGMVFADLSTAPITLPPGGFSFVGSTPISSQVSSMQARWGFTLSGGGQASGTSHFQIMGDVVPEPASMLLLGLGGLALIRKRKT